MANIKMKWSLVIVGLLTALAIQVGAFIVTQSNTFDEACYIGAGAAYITTGKLEIEQGFHPPLQKYLMGLAILPLSPSFPFGSDNFKRLQPFRFGHEFLFENRVKPELLLAMGRLPSLLLSLLLAIFVLIWATRWFGESGGILALTAYVFEPNLLTHGGIASMDIGVTTFMFMASYFLMLFLEENKTKSLIASGVMAGLAMSIKLSGMFFFAWAGILLLTVPYLDSRATIKAPLKLKIFKAIKSILVLLFLSAIVVGTVYQWRYVKNFGSLIGTLFEVVFQHPPFQDYANFLHGERKVGGWWYYFILAFFIKTPLPWLTLIGLGCYFVPRKKKIPLLLLVFSFLIICTVAQKQNGLRYYLPAFPIFCLLIGGLAPALEKRSWLKWAVGGLVTWLIIETLSLVPNTIPYFNQLAGGPANGYKWLVNCNLDFGQDFPKVREFLKQQGNPEVIMACFGNGDRDYYFGTRQDLIADSNNIDRYFKHINSPRPQRELLVVSATLLQGFGLSDPDGFAWLRTKTPLAQIANSTFVYDVTFDVESQFQIGQIYFRNHQSELAQRQLTRANDLISRYRTAEKLHSKPLPSPILP